VLNTTRIPERALHIETSSGKIENREGDSERAGDEAIFGEWQYGLDDLYNLNE
jgi:hypothetical protein